mgnify:CR=1 FL=1
MKSDVKPTVCVVGLGYIGLPTAAIVARSGCKVHGVDVSSHVVDTINRGEIHIEEVDLDGLVHGVVQRGLLRASTQIEPADVFVIAVPTPVSEDHAPDISYVLNAAKAVDAVATANPSPSRPDPNPKSARSIAARLSRPRTLAPLSNTSPDAKAFATSANSRASASSAPKTSPASAMKSS